MIDDKTVTDDRPETGGGTASAGRRRWVLPGVLVILVLALVLTAVVQLRDRDGDAARALRPADIGVPGENPEGLPGSAVLLARQAVTFFYRIDHRHVRRDLDRLRRLATPDFADQYVAAGRRTRARVLREKLTSLPTLVDDGTATEFLSSDAAQVLVAADVSTERARGRATQTRHRTRVLLVRVGDRWRVDGIEELG